MASSKAAVIGLERWSDILVSLWLITEWSITDRTRHKGRKRTYWIKIPCRPFFPCGGRNRFRGWRGLVASVSLGGHGARQGLRLPGHCRHTLGKRKVPAYSPLARGATPHPRTGCSIQRATRHIGNSASRSAGSVFGKPERVSTITAEHVVYAVLYRRQSQDRREKLTGEPIVTEAGLVAFVASLAETFREIETSLHVAENDPKVFRKRLAYLIDCAAHHSIEPLSEDDRISLRMLHGLLESMIQGLDSSRVDPPIRPNR